MKEPAKQRQAGRREKEEGGGEEEKRGGGDLLPKHSEKSLAQRVVRRRDDQRDITLLTHKDDLQKSRSILGSSVKKRDPFLRREETGSHLDALNGVANA